MDEGETILRNDTKEKRQISNDLLNGWDVSEPIWIRCDSNNVDRIDRKLLECELGYVLPCGIILWIIFLLFG